MLRKKEKELENLLSEKNEELKKKQQEIEERNTQILSLQKSLDAANEQIKGLQAREGNVVSAMAEIEAMRSGKIMAAEARAREITAQAQKCLDEAGSNAAYTKEQAKNEAQAVVTGAQKEAEAILQDAKERTDVILAQAIATRQDYIRNTSEMNKQLNWVAERCATGLEALKTLSEQLHIPENKEETDTEINDMLKALHAQPVSTPESYENPSELMRSIYAIEQRELPEKEDGESKQAEEIKLPEGGEEANDNDANAAEQENASQHCDDEDGHVWTVDEIVDSVLDDEKEAQSNDGYLEKLIEEILQ